MPHLRQCGAIVAVRYTSIHLWGQEDAMLTLRTLAIVITGAGVFAGLPLTGAQACDDDRYPCPIRAEAATQETAPAQATPSAQPQKKASHAARPTAKAQAKPEREAPRAAARAKASKPAAQEQAADSISQKAAEAPPAMVPSPPADQPLNDESGTESPVATAATAWPVFPATEGAGARALGATSADATEAAKTNAVTNAVQVVDLNEVNDLDRAAAATVPAESSWLSYLLLILGAALAAASAFWFFSRTTSLFARRAAHPRV
jgi:hypothetical protein